MHEDKGALFMLALIAFIIASSFFFKGNPLDDDEGCQRYSQIANDC